MLANAREVHCLACARTLALVVPADHGYRLLPPASHIHALVRQTAGGVRCSRCGGFPYIEG
jgi:hypothetical protein